MHVHVGIGLIVGGLGAVALGVGHGAVHGEVVVLHHGQELLEVLMIVGAVLLVHLKGGGEHRVERVHAHAALEAAGGLLAQQALHLHLVDEVLGGLVQVGEAVDGVARQAGLHRHQVGILGVLGQSVGHGHAVDGRADHGVVHPVLNLLPEHIHPGIQFAQALYILLCGHQCHFFFSSSKKWGSFTFQCVPSELRLPGTPWPAPLGAAPSPCEGEGEPGSLDPPLAALRRFRGSGAICGPVRAGNRIAATVEILRLPPVPSAHL